MSQVIASPFSVFYDRSGQPLDNGYIYIGTAGINPETSPITVYWDLSLAVTAAQPIRTLAGYPSQSGSPGTIIINQTTYSIVVRDRNGTLVYSDLNAFIDGDVNRYVATYAELTALTTATGLNDGAVYYTRARTTASDGGNGSWRYDATSTATANGGTILAIDGGGPGRFFRLLEANRIVWVQWFGDLTTASGFTAALRAAITAAGVGGEVHIPYGTYTYNDSFTVLSAQRIIGHGLPFMTKAANVAQTFIMTNATRAEIDGIGLFGAGGTYTGTGVYMGAHADSYEQRVINCLIYDFAGPCVHFDGADAGSKAEVINGLMRRTNYTVDAAIVGTTTVDTAGNRKITDIITDGGVIVAVNKTFNTEISGCNGRSIDFSGSDTIQTRARVYGNRLATTGVDQDIYGNDNSIVGNVIAGGLVLKGAASRNHISGNVLAASKVPEDQSTAVGDNCNWIDDAEYTFTPIIKADTTDPTLWASTYGRIQRRGKTLTINCGATAGGSTTFGTGAYYVTLPSPFAAFVAKGQTTGTVRILDSGAQYYAGTCSIAAGGSRIYMFVTQGVGPTHPMTWANGDTFDISISFEIS